MKAVTFLRIGMAAILLGILINFEATSWSSHLLPAGMSSSTQPVYIVDDTQKASYVFASEILGVLGVLLTSIAAFRLVKVP